MHLILRGFDTPCFLLPGHKSHAVTTLYLCGFNASDAPYTHFFLSILPCTERERKKLVTLAFHDRPHSFVIPGQTHLF